MIHVDIVADVHWLRMESGKVQALDLELATELSAALDRAVGDGAPPLVLTGTGSSFSAGVDLFRVVDADGRRLSPGARSLSSHENRHRPRRHEDRNHRPR